MNEIIQDDITVLNIAFPPVMLELVAGHSVTTSVVALAFIAAFWHFGGELYGIGGIAMVIDSCSFRVPTHHKRKRRPLAFRGRRRRRGWWERLCDPTCWSNCPQRSGCFVLRLPQWSGWPESNRRLLAPKASALPS